MDRELTREEIEEVNCFRDVDENRDRWFNEFLPRAIEGLQSCYDKGHRICVANKLEEIGLNTFGASQAIKEEIDQDAEELFGT